GELVLAERVQEIALVLVRVATALEPPATIDLVDARVVAGRDALGAEPARLVEEAAELDLAIAEDVGIRRASGAVLREETRENLLAVLGREVACMERQAERGTDRDGVATVGVGAAFTGFVLVPVLHEQAGGFASRALQEQRGDRRIDPAGQADDDRRAGHGAAAGSWPGANQRSTSSGWRRPAIQSSMLASTIGLRRRSRAAATSSRDSQTARTIPLSSGRSGSWRSASAANVKRRKWRPPGAVLHCEIATRWVGATCHAVSSTVSRRAASVRLSPASRWPAGWFSTQRLRTISSTSRKRPSRATIVATVTSGRQIPLRSGEVVRIVFIRAAVYKAMAGRTWLRGSGLQGRTGAGSCAAALYSGMAQAPKQT